MHVRLAVTASKLLLLFCEVDLPEILGLVSPHGGVVAILGHMHEPWKCHRLHFCHPLYLAGATVEHLLWASSFKAETQPHLQVFQKSKEKERYWNMAEEEFFASLKELNHAFNFL